MQDIFLEKCCHCHCRPAVKIQELSTNIKELSAAPNMTSLGLWTLDFNIGAWERLYVSITQFYRQSVVFSRQQPEGGSRASVPACIATAAFRLGSPWLVLLYRKADRVTAMSTQSSPFSAHFYLSVSTLPKVPMPSNRGTWPISDTLIPQHYLQIISPGRSHDPPPDR